MLKRCLNLQTVVGAALALAIAFGAKTGLAQVRIEDKAPTRPLNQALWETSRSGKPTIVVVTSSSSPDSLRLWESIERSRFARFGRFVSIQRDAARGLRRRSPSFGTVERPLGFALSQDRHGLGTRGPLGSAEGRERSVCLADGGRIDRRDGRAEGLVGESSGGRTPGRGIVASAAESAVADAAAASDAAGSSTAESASGGEFSGATGFDSAGGGFLGVADGSVSAATDERHDRADAAADDHIRSESAVAAEHQRRDSRRRAAGRAELNVRAVFVSTVAGRRFSDSGQYSPADRHVADHDRSTCLRRRRAFGLVRRGFEQSRPVRSLPRRNRSKIGPSRLSQGPNGSSRARDFPDRGGATDEFLDDGPAVAAGRDRAALFSAPGERPSQPARGIRIVAAGRIRPTATSPLPILQA